MTDSIDSGRVKFEVPEGFSILTEEEILALGGKKSSESKVLRDADRHINIEAMWKKVPLLARGITIEKAAANTVPMYKRIAPAFEYVSDIKKEISGLPAAGFRFAFTSTGIECVTEYIMFRKDNMFYAFSFTCRKENLNLQYPVFTELLDSIAT